jgi:hypothetical protein
VSALESIKIAEFSRKKLAERLLEDMALSWSVIVVDKFPCKFALAMIRGSWVQALSL